MVTATKSEGASDELRELIEMQQRKILSLEEAGGKVKAIAAIVGFVSALGTGALAFGAMYARFADEIRTWDRIKESHRVEANSPIYDHASLEDKIVADAIKELKTDEDLNFATADQLPKSSQLVPSGSALCFFGRTIPSGWELADASAKWPDADWIQSTLHGVTLPNMNSGAYVAGTGDSGKIATVSDPEPLIFPQLNIGITNGISLSSPTSQATLQDRTVKFVRSNNVVDNTGILSTSSENYGSIVHTTVGSNLSYSDSRIASIVIPSKNLRIDSRNMPPTVFCRWMIKTS